MDNNSFNHEDEAAFLRELTLQDFRDVGLHQIAYIKQVDNVNNTAVNFSIHVHKITRISPAGECGRRRRCEQMVVS